jgi:hypothetical protein
MNNKKDVIMKFRQSDKLETSEDILNQVNKCKPTELKSLLDKIQTIIEQSEGKDMNLLMAKTMITSRLASMKSK